MKLDVRIAQLPPRRRRRLQRLATVVVPVTAVMTVVSVGLSVATIRMLWGHSTGLVGLSVGLATLGVVLCGVAGINARRTLRACRAAEAASATTNIRDAIPTWCA